MNKKLLLIVIPVVLVLLAPSVYFYTKYQKVSTELKKVAPESKEQIAKLLEKVGALIELPTDEEPTVATVTDKEKLKEQKFFTKAENDDKVIIYAKAMKAILYRPSLNKIIEVARIDTATDGNVAGTATVSAVPVATPTVEQYSVAVYNGTETVGISQKLVEMIKGKVNGTVSLKVNASRKDYEKNMVIDISKKGSVEAKKLAILLSGGVVEAEFPIDEATPSADILVILGSEFVK